MRISTVLLAFQAQLLFLCAHTTPFAIDKQIDDKIVASGNPNIQRNRRAEQSTDLRQYGRHMKPRYTEPTAKFRWSNSSWMDKLDEMMKEIERDLERLFNDTSPYGDLFDSDESFSFSKSESESSEAETGA